jgi:hypothetical protein
VNLACKAPGDAVGRTILVDGGFLGALAVVVAFGPELGQAVVRLRQRGAPDRRSISVEPTPS